MKHKLVYHQSIGKNLLVDYDTELYNGYSYQQLENIVNSLNWHKADKIRYMKNVAEVIEIQISGVNLNQIYNLKNQNFAITKFYLENSINQ